MSDDDLQPSSFTKEKNLWEIFLQARRIPTAKFNSITTFLIASAATAAVWVNPQPIGETIRFVREGATLGFNASLAMLGFLVAGFTIFATISNPNMLIRMGGMRNSESGLSWLKHTFFLLIRVFIYYLSFSIFCFIIIFFGAKNGLIGSLLRFSPHCEEVKFSLVNLSSIILVTWQYFVLIQLKSFIYNIYSSVVATLRWKAEGYD